MPCTFLSYQAEIENVVRNKEEEGLTLPHSLFSLICRTDI